MADAGILVVRGGAIGDFILTLPVLSALRAQFPRAQIGVMGYPRIADLAKQGGLVDQIYSLEAQGMARLFARGAEMDPGWKQTWGGAVIIVSYLYDPDGIFRENVARCSSAQFIQGPHRPNDAGEVHAAHALLEPLQRLAVFDFDPQPRLRLNPPKPSGLTAELLEWVSNDSVIAVHPGSGSRSKNWPVERWTEVLSSRLQGYNDRCLIVGGEADEDRPERLQAGLPQGRVRVVRNLGLAQLGVVLGRCRAFLGHDSGISHLAAAVGVPTLVLWGPTVQKVWRPVGDHVRVVDHPLGMSGITVESVQQAIHGMIPSEHSKSS